MQPLSLAEETKDNSGIRTKGGIVARWTGSCALPLFPYFHTETYTSAFREITASCSPFFVSFFVSAMALVIVAPGSPTASLVSKRTKSRSVSTVPDVMNSRSYLSRRVNGSEDPNSDEPDNGLISNLPSAKAETMWRGQHRYPLVISAEYLFFLLSETTTQAFDVYP